MTNNNPQTEPRLAVFRWPTRHARDADHLAIVALVGGAFGVCRLRNIAADVWSWWLAASVLSLIGAPLLWLRIPLAKWLTVAATCCLAITVFIGNQDGSLSLEECVMFGGIAILAVWYARINYLVRFEHAD